ncbi:MAG: lipase maturation factor family protein [Phycisphaerales bacterium]|nr:lipase maturation factor family protein [Phycisphaerales bacterium]
MGCGSCTSCGDGGCQGLLPEADLPTSLPLVVYDGNCGFCRRWLKRYEALTPPGKLAWASYQKAAGTFPGIPEAQFQKAIHLVQPDGSHTRGAEAVFEIMNHADLRSWPLWCQRNLPPFRATCNGLYRVVARNRRMAGTGGRLLWGSLQIPSTTLLTRRIFLRLLGLIYLLAFLSIGSQAAGLIGPDGLQPYEQRLEQIETYANAEGTSAFLLNPTILWAGGPGLLDTTWIIGLIAASALVLGLVPMLSMGIAWACYLSIVNVAGVFTGYQWDALLLEVGFLAIFWAPCSWRLNSQHVRRSSTLLRWMLLWLLMRFMFTSGWVKLASNDPTWWDLTALDYHYWSQPLPWWPAWYAWQLPMWWQKASCLIMFIIELGVPFLVIFPRVPRLIAFLALVLLQIGILITGNYGFFNWLTIVLCLVLLDDSQLLWLWPKRARGMIRVGLTRRESPPRRVLNVIVALLLLSLTIPITVSQLQDKRVSAWPRTMAPWHVANGYGLFRVMTKTRPEITIEGSNDGVTWLPYMFRWKPGPLDRAPAFSQPGMPRLDWQMWFDALNYELAWERGYLPNGGGLARGSNAFASVNGGQVTPALCASLARGDAAVLDLLASSPFPAGQPPRYLRWHLDHYQFTTADQRDETGNWWTSKRLFTSGVLKSTPELSRP